MSWCRRRPLLRRNYSRVALVYCDPQEPPLLWDYRAREFLRKERNGFFLLFVCHWSQLNQVHLLLSSFPMLMADALPIDRCCKWWFDSPEIQAVVLRVAFALKIPGRRSCGPRAVTGSATAVRRVFANLPPGFSIAAPFAGPNTRSQISAAVCDYPHPSRPAPKLSHQSSPGSVVF